MQNGLYICVMKAFAKLGHNYIFEILDNVNIITKDIRIN